MEAQDTEIIWIYRLEKVLMCLGWIHQLRVENIEFVALNCFGWRVVMVVMRLIVLVPIIASLDHIEVPWLPRCISIFPGINIASHQINFISQA